MVERVWGATQVLNWAKFVEVMFEEGDDNIQVPTNDVGLGQAPLRFVAIPVF